MAGRLSQTQLVCQVLLARKGLAGKRMTQQPQLLHSTISRDRPQPAGEPAERMRSIPLMPSDDKLVMVSSGLPIP